MAKRDLSKAETESVVGTDKTAADVASESTANVNQAATEGAVVQTSPTYTPINGANTAGNRVSEAEIKHELKEAQRKLSSKKLKSVSIPKQLAATIGDVLPACINGVCIKVPVDGEEYEVPEPYVEIIRNSLKTINSGDVRATLKAGANDGADALVAKRK